MGLDSADRPRAGFSQRRAKLGGDERVVWREPSASRRRRRLGRHRHTGSPNYPREPRPVRLGDRPSGWRRSRWERPRRLLPALNRFVWTWPVCVFVAYPLTTNVAVWARSSNHQRAAWAARASILGMLAVGYVYFVSCEQLGLSILWSFLVGVLPAWPLSIGAARTSRSWARGLWLGRRSRSSTGARRRFWAGRRCKPKSGRRSVQRHRAT